MNFNIAKIIMWVFTLLLISSCALNQSTRKNTNDQNLTSKQSKKIVATKKTRVNRQNTQYSKSNIQISTLEIQNNIKQNRTVNLTLANRPQFEFKCISKLQCVSLIQHKIIDLWKFPRNYPKYKTILVLELSTSGHIATIRLKRSSGLRGYDDSVIKAVRGAAPFREITFLPAIDVQEFSSLELVFKR